MKKKADKPLRNRCDCGAKVKNHHLLCDDCWGRRARQKARRTKYFVNKNGEKVYFKEK